MLKYLDFKEAKCKNCYKCLKNCPVKAIKIEENQAKVIEDRCILCGRCTLICPQNAKKVHTELDDVKNLLKNNKVIASVAPSFISSFNLKNFATINSALKKVGFEFAEETARGAELVIDEYEKLLKEKKYKNFITSCCPAVNTLISLYYPNALKYLAPVDSPVIAHAKVLKKENPDAKIVFIGPCIAKKKECRESGLIDNVLTFEELIELLKENEIDLQEIDAAEEVSWNRERFFPISRGIIKSFEELADGYEYIAMDGVEKCKEALQKIDDLENVFLELNSCESACINGPCSLNKDNTAIIANAKIRNYVKDNSGKNEKNVMTKLESVDITCNHKKCNLKDIEPTEEQIREVLEKTGKYTKEDELNCGACGYSTCREKAWAFINGYADVEMCLPYMRERAESISNEIIQNSPNGIVVIDTAFNITDINNKAKILLGIKRFKPNSTSILDCLEDNVDFIEALAKQKNISSKRIKIEKTNSYIELSINYMKDHNMIFAIMKDITDKVNYEDKLQEVKLETIAATDEVIKKQMRVAQEIASLLGETTAEAKVALVNLRNTLNADNEGEK